jgi:DNA-binding NarL/FixJ family response regulator
MNARLRILVVEDESFTRQLLSEALDAQGFEAIQCSTTKEAIEIIKLREPNVLISDLDLGPGPSGVDLMRVVARDYPWIGLVALSAHSAPLLVGSAALPEGTPYLVKSNIEDLSELGVAIRNSLSQLRFNERVTGDSNDGIIVSEAQAETLRMLSTGLTNKAISAHRGTSLRATETLIQRTYQALGLVRTSDQNMRVEAVGLWRSGRVKVR